MPEILVARGLRGRGRARRRGVRPVLDLEGALVECERSRHDFLFAREAHDVRVPPGGEILEPHGVELREGDLGLRVELVAQAARLRHGRLGDRTSGDEDVEKDLPGPALHLPARRDDREDRRAGHVHVLAVLLADVERDGRERAVVFDGLAPWAHGERAQRVRSLWNLLEEPRLRDVVVREDGREVVENESDVLARLRRGILKRLVAREIEADLDGPARRGGLSRRGGQGPDEYESETRDEGLHETRESRVRGVHGGSRTPYKLMSRPPDGVSERGGYQQERGRNMKDPGPVQSRVQPFGGEKRPGSAPTRTFVRLTVDFRVLPFSSVASRSYRVTRPSRSAATQ